MNLALVHVLTKLVANPDYHTITFAVYSLTTTKKICLQICKCVFEMHTIHKTFWAKAVGDYHAYQLPRMPAKPLHTSLHTELSWNSNQVHVVGIPVWGFVKIFHVFYSLLHLSKVQIIAWGSLHFYFVILYFWPFPSQKATSYIQQNVVRCLPSTRDRADHLWHLLSLLSLLLSVIFLIGNTTHQVSSTDSF